MLEFLLLALTISIAGVVWLRIGIARREEEREAAERDGYWQRIAQDPQNAAAWEALGDSLRRSRRIEEARDCYQGALERQIDDSPQDRTQYKIRQIDAEIARRAAARASGPFGLPLRSPKIEREMYFCAHCGGGNSLVARVCETCNAPLPLEDWRDALKEKEIYRATLEATSIIAVLLVALHVFDTLPLDIKGVLIISTTIVLAYRFLQVIEGHRRVK